MTLRYKKLIAVALFVFFVAAPELQPVFVSQYSLPPKPPVASTVPGM